MDTSKVTENKTVRISRKRARSSIAEDAVRSASVLGVSAVGLARSKSRVRDRSEMGIRDVKVLNTPHIYLFSIYFPNSVTNQCSKNSLPPILNERRNVRVIWMLVKVKQIVLCWQVVQSI